MTKELTQYRRTINAGETTLLTLTALAQFMGFGRTRIHADVKRGYRLEFGDRTTPRHYRAWLSANPRQRKKSEKKSTLEHELSQLN